MTLIAGFKCRDGFVVAADTETSYGGIRYQAHKLANYSGESTHYDIVVGGAGDAGYIDSISQKIQAGVAALANPTFQEIQRIIEKKIIALYRTHIFKYWEPGDPFCPHISLVVGIEDVNRRFGIVATSRTAVSEAGDYAFAGTGDVIANHITEKLWVAGLSTASTRHLASQIFREVKAKGSYVGGNTEIICRRSTSNAESFFDVSLDDSSRLLKKYSHSAAEVC